MNKLFSMMGLCRKAGKLALGHDVTMESIRKNQSALILFSSDASPRHKREIEAVKSQVDCRELRYSSTELSYFVGKKCCLFSVNDIGFAQTIQRIIDEEEHLYGIEIQNS